MGPDNVRRECEQLADYALKGAEKLLEEDGAFSPHALTMADNGDIEVVFAEAGAGLGTADEDYGALIQNLRDEASNGDHRAVAVVLNTWIDRKDGQGKRDAVVVQVDHREQCSLETYRYYAIEERFGDAPATRAVEWIGQEDGPGESLIFEPQ